MKRGRENVQKFRKSVWLYHNTPREHFQHIRKYAEKVPKRDRQLFFLNLDTVWEDRSFFGFVPRSICLEHYALLDAETGPHRYFISFSTTYFGTLSVHYSETTEFGRLVRGYRAKNIEDVYTHIKVIENRMGYPLIPMDRGECIMYERGVKREVKNAILLWSLCAKRLGLGKDIARYIGEIMWDMRFAWMP